MEILFMNIHSLRNKKWDNFLSPVRLMMSWMMVCDIQINADSCQCFGWMFLPCRKSVVNFKINVFSIIDWRCIFLFTYWLSDNRFDSENQNLRPLETAAHASEELVNDFKSAYEDGDTLLKDSINTQLIWKSRPLFDLYPKNNRKTFVNFKLPDINKKHSRRDRNFSFICNYWLVYKTDQELTETIFEHRITGSCLSILKSNGTKRKCQKSKMLQEIHLKSIDLQMQYCSRRDGIIVETINTIFSWQRKKVMRQSTHGKIMGTKLSKQYLEGILLLLWL